MVPSFQALNAMPKTPNGKAQTLNSNHTVDRRGVWHQPEGRPRRLEQVLYPLVDKDLYELLLFG